MQLIAEPEPIDTRDSAEDQGPGEIKKEIADHARDDAAYRGDNHDENSAHGRQGMDPKEI